MIVSLLWWPILSVLLDLYAALQREPFFILYWITIGWLASYSIHRTNSIRCPTTCTASEWWGV
jgi:hypothetical protein